MAAMLVSACNPKATHLTQNLENSSAPGRRYTQTPEGAAQTPGLGGTQAQSPSPIDEPTATSVEQLPTQVPSVTSAPVLTPTSSATVQVPTAASRSTTPPVVTSTLAPTQTRTITPTQTRTVTSTQTHTSTLTPSVTATPTQTATLALTPTLQTGWGGEWTFYLDSGSGGYLTGALSITLDGDNVLGEAVINGSNYEFVGQLSADGTSIMGDYTNGTELGWFYWVFLSDSQFGGTLDNRFAFCASRNDAERPGQCGYFLIS